MNSEKKQTLSDVWIDVTDLMDWKGHFSGIQRLVYAYAQRYATAGARYFSYDKKRNQFHVVSADDLFGPKGMLSDKKVKTGAKEHVRTVYQSVVPARARKLTTPAARLILSSVYSSRDRAAAKRPAVVPFGTGDTVLFMGAGWESSGMIEQVARAKSQYGLRVVHLWHDFLPLTQPHLFDEQLYQRQYAYTKRALEISDTTVTVSKATKADIVSFAKNNKIKLAGKVAIVREGEDAFTSVEPVAPQSFDTKRNFILALGTVEVRKNHQLLYQAYKLSAERGLELPELVIVGRKGWLADDLAYLLENDASVAGRITVLGNASDAEVAWLLQNCQFTAFPSLCEGWGLPICESLSNGKFVLTCNLSSMPEVAGDLAGYFSPYSTDECLGKLYEYSSDKSKLKAAEDKIATQYTCYTWDASFAQLLKAVHSN